MSTEKDDLYVDVRGVVETEAVDTPKRPDLIMGQQSGIGKEIEEVLRVEHVDYDGTCIEHLLTVGGNPELFRYFIWLAKRTGIDLVLHTDANSTLRLRRPDSNCEVVLVVREIDTFVQEMESLYRLFEERYVARIDLPDERGKYEFEMCKHERFFEILSDATPFDLQSLGDFFLRRRQELFNGPIIEWNSTRELAGGNMTMTSSTSGEGMEGYFQFSSTYLTEGKRVALSEVRYGKISKSEAVIYSVQNPKINGESPKSAEITLRSLAKHRQRLQEICEKLETVPTFFVNGVINDEELLKFYEIGWDHADPILIALGMQQAETTLVFRYVELLRKKADLEKVVEGSQMNQEAVRAINKVLRSGLHKKLGSIRNAPGQAFLAFLGAIKVLHESGVRKIRIPMKLPLRTHYWQEEIDEHIYNGKLTLVKRLVFELEGITANTEECAFNVRDMLMEKDGGSGVDYLVVDLADVITPKREVIQQIWNG
jgi:hypothetical protein